MGCSLVDFKYPSFHDTNNIKPIFGVLVNICVSSFFLNTDLVHNVQLALIVVH